MSGYGKPNPTYETGVVGQNYYVRNGLIESSAPNLTPEEIVI
jgi:hypothetical protein